jgi:hypothetical protein
MFFSASRRARQQTGQFGPDGPGRTPTLQGGAGLLWLIFTLWLCSFRAGGIAALAKSVVWTLIWPLWGPYLIAFVGVRL